MHTARNGIFITFEGIEGSGKSTQIDLLAGHLGKRGYDVVVTREPGGTNIGDSIRNVLLDPDFAGMNFLAELFLYAASRAQLVSEVIKPALAAGKIVLCDRFADSSLAYQGYGRGVSLKIIRQLNELATQNISPHLTIILSVPTEDGLDRATQHYADRIEKEAIHFHRLVKEGYEKLALQDPERIHLFDATAGPQDVHQRIADLVEELLKKKEE